MNLRALANSMTRTLNPNVQATLSVGIGYTVKADGTPVPNYLQPPVPMLVQVQDLSQKDIKRLDYLNIQGINVVIYLNGEASSIVRRDRKGGDLITILEGCNAGQYLTTEVSEQWSEWVRIVATLQNS
jgi:hypothetical protein